MTGVCGTRVKRSPFALPNNLGVSGVARALQRQEMAALEEMLNPSMTVGVHHRETLRNVVEALEKLTVDEQDGRGVKAADAWSYANAVRFAALLPIIVPVPEVYVDTDGEARFEWYRGPRQVFSVAIRGNGELAYAGLFGASNAYGTEYLGDELPEHILSCICRVYS
jgi:hypothetical protein